MANETQLNLLKQSVAKFNEWRKENPDKLINLRGADLTSADLRDAKLIRTDLNAADLRGAKLIRADLSAANLDSTDLISANLDSADLSAADLTGAYIHDAKFDAKTKIDENTTMDNAKRQYITSQIEQSKQPAQAPEPTKEPQATEGVTVIPTNEVGVTQIAVYQPSAGNARLR